MRIVNFMSAFAVVLSTLLLSNTGFSIHWYATDGAQPLVAGCNLGFVNENCGGSAATINYDVCSDATTLQEKYTAHSALAGCGTAAAAGTCKIQACAAEINCNDLCREIGGGNAGRCVTQVINCFSNDNIPAGKCECYNTTP